MAEPSLSSFAKEIKQEWMNVVGKGHLVIVSMWNTIIHK